MVAFRILDHSSDIGLELTAPTLPELFQQAALGFYSVLLVNPDSVRNRLSREFELRGDDREELLVDWLAELNYRFSVDGELYSQFELTVADTRLQAHLRGERFDMKRHACAREIKAITYHQLSLKPAATGGWTARVIFDI